MNSNVIFDIKYTPFTIDKNIGSSDILLHNQERAFYNMTGATNVYNYMTTTIKQLYYGLPNKSDTSGVFNFNGKLTNIQIKEVKNRAKENQGNIWHGFISLQEKDKYKIDNIKKCTMFIKDVFTKFFNDCDFNIDNMDLICALHTDKPNHYHIHFVFFEKQPKTYNYNGDKKQYKRFGRINKRAIDNMYYYINDYLSKANTNPYFIASKAVLNIKELNKLLDINKSNSELIKELTLITKSLPKIGNLQYSNLDKDNSQKIDKIVQDIINSDNALMSNDEMFYSHLQSLKENKVAYGLPIKSITSEALEKIKSEYIQDNGNLIINLAKKIDAHLYEKSPEIKYETSSKILKKKLSVSKRSINSIFNNFMSSFINTHKTIVNKSISKLNQMHKDIALKEETKEFEK